MKRALFIFAIVCAIVYIFFVHSGIAAISEKGAGIDISSDAEINYLTALSVYRGERWYKDFNNVYPPGRFIAQAALFKLLAPSVPTATLYFNSFALFFSVALFFLSAKLFSALNYKKQISYLLATIATLMYLFFIRSDQEAHTVAAVFFIVLSHPFNRKRAKQIVLGALLGIVFLFRIDAGILLAISVVINRLITHKNVQRWLLGAGLVWIPILLYIWIYGSIANFFYDTVYYALIVQPKVINLPIPPAPVGLLFYSMLIFLFSSVLSLSIRANSLHDKKKDTIKAFALFSLLSFTAALGRSDEGHLWYGSVWAGFYAGYAVSHFFQSSKVLKELKIVIIPLIVMFLLLGFILITAKHFLLFIAVSVMIFLFTTKVPRRYSVSMLISGIVASLLIFHSFSFLRLRFSPPHTNFSPLPQYFTFVSEGSEIAGLQFTDKTLAILQDIRNRLDYRSKCLFIYPDHAFLYEYFKLNNPTRHDYQLKQTTQKVQQEIVADLKQSFCKNFIIFPDSINDNRTVWQWIKKNTVVDSAFILNNTKVEVRKKSK